MNKETIEKAAKANASEYFSLINKEWWARKNGFEDGAAWRINSVWHSPNELPRIESLVVSIYEDGHITIVRVKSYYNSVPVKTWAYLDDLLPERKEATHD